MLIIVRAWYGGPKNSRGKVYHGNDLTLGWLWQTGACQGKDVTAILRAAVNGNGELDFNRERDFCNELFDFGRGWACCKILVVQYKYGERGQVQTWFSPSVADEPYHCYLPAEPRRGAKRPRVTPKVAPAAKKAKSTAKAGADAKAARVLKAKAKAEEAAAARAVAEEEARVARVRAAARAAEEEEEAREARVRAATDEARAAEEARVAAEASAARARVAAAMESHVPGPVVPTTNLTSAQAIERILQIAHRPPKEPASSRELADMLGLSSCFPRHDSNVFKQPYKRVAHMIHPDRCKLPRAQEAATALNASYTRLKVIYDWT
jgi:hypothetical protein